MATKSIEERLIPAIQYETPTTGATVTVSATGHIKLIIDPAGTLATLTVTLPGTPQNNDMVQLGSSQIVTALTMNGGTVVGALTTLAVGGFATYVYSSTAVKWFRVG